MHVSLRRSIEEALRKAPADENPVVVSANGHGDLAYQRRGSNAFVSTEVDVALHVKLDSGVVIHPGEKLDGDVVRVYRGSGDINHMVREDHHVRGYN